MIPPTGALPSSKFLPIKMHFVLFSQGSTVEIASRLRRLETAAVHDSCIAELLKGVTKLLHRYPSSSLLNLKHEGPRAEDRVVGSLIQLAENTCRSNAATWLLELTAQLGEAVILLRQRAWFGREYDGQKLIPLGFGCGMLSATVLAACPSVDHVLRPALAIIEIGLRLAIELNNRAVQIEGSDGEWSYITIDADAETVTSQLQQVNQALPPHRHAYIGVTGPTTVHVCGPSSTISASPLSQLEDLSDIDIDLPGTMYAPHLAPLDASAICAPLHDDLNYALLHPLYCTKDGSLYDSSDMYETVKLIVEQLAGHVMCVDGLISKLIGLGAEESEFTIIGGCSPEVNKLRHLITQCLAEKGVQMQHTDISDVGKPSKKDRDSIAIVGMSGRFPGCESIDEFWTLLENNASTLAEIPSSRFQAENCSRTLSRGQEGSNIRFGNFIKNPGHFDNRFFQISPAEAMQMDPQQRISLMVTYEALEMAGHAGRSCDSHIDPARIATYWGQTTDDWKTINQQRGIDTHYLPGVNRGFTPGRISRYFGWGGPFYSIDTGCSSSATCISLAYDALLAGQVDMAVAGGVNLLATPEWFLGLGIGGFLSKTGSCKTFADSADGYCRGEAVAVLVLKRLEDAISANDNILAVIDGAARNSNARYSTSLTGPSQAAQESLYRQVLRQSGTASRDVDCVEMHGTGTQAGDRTEMTAVRNVFAGERTKQNPLIVGAVKANVGHCEAAAGIVSVIKAVLMLQHKKIPSQPGLPFQINRNYGQLADDYIFIAGTHPASAKSRPRTILVNSFDAAGGNTSMVVLDHRASKTTTEQPDPRLWHTVVISGHSQAACDSNRARLHNHLLAHPDVPLSDIAYTTTTRRTHHDFRCCYTVDSVKQLTLELSHQRQPIAASAGAVTLFVFAGQGSQYEKMGAGLYSTSPKFRQLLARYERVCQSTNHFGFLGLITGDCSSYGKACGRDQIAIVALEIALAEYLISLGLRPTAVIGHSLGEYAALCIAGVLSASDVFWLLHKRAVLLEECCSPNTYKMLSVQQPAVQISKAGCEISCYNSPQATTISGSEARIAEVQVEMATQNVKTSLLNVEYAYHSSQVDPILTAFEEVASQIPFRTPEIAVFSTVLGRTVHPGEDVFDASYIARHVRDPVSFLQAIQASESENLIDDGSLVVEISPHATCIGMVESSLQHARPTALTTLRRGRDDGRGISSCLGRAYESGIHIDWDAFHAPYAGHLNVSILPPYAFDLKSFWEPFRIPETADKTSEDISHSPKALLSSTLHMVHSVREDAKQKTGIFSSSLSREDLRQAIEGHSVDGNAICPTSIFVDMAVSASIYLIHDGLSESALAGIELSALKITAPLVVHSSAAQQTARIEATLDRQAQTVSVHISSSTDGKTYTRHAACGVRIAHEPQKLDSQWKLMRPLIAARLKSIDSLDSEEAFTHTCDAFYDTFAETVQYADPYKTVAKAAIPLEYRDAAASLRLSPVSTADKFLCSPYVVDAAVHLPGYLLNANPGRNSSSIHISNSVGQIRFHRSWRHDRKYRAYVSIRDDESNDTRSVCDVYVFDSSHKLFLTCNDIQFQKLEKDIFQQLVRQAHRAHQTLSIETDSSSDELDDTSSISTTATSLATPRDMDDKVNSLVSVIAAKSGLTPNEIETASSFSDIGIDSQMSISIMAEYGKKTGSELPASLLSPSLSMGDVREQLTGFAPAATSGEIADSAVLDISHCPATLADTEKADFDVLLDVVMRTLGINMSDIADQTKWSSLGMDSMQSIRILSDFRKSTGVELPASLFIETPTVQQTRRELQAQNSSTNSAPVRVASSPAKIRARPSQDTHRLVSRSVLLQGSPQSSAPPLFLLTDGSGTTEAYIHFPRLPHGRRTYGLESPFVNNPLDYKITLSAVATIFIGTIRRIQPTGPYFIGGWSMGGKYAYEVCRQLSLAGEEIALLMIMDTRPPRPRPVKVSYDFGTIEDIGMTGARGKNLYEDFTQRERDHLYASCVVNTREQMLPFAEHQSRPRLTAIVWATKGLNDHPDPSRHNLQITRKAAMGDVEEEEAEIEQGGIEAMRMVYKSWFFGKRQDFGTNGWEKWVRGTRQDGPTKSNDAAAADIIVETVEGDHFSMIAPPEVAQLGRHVVKMVDIAAARAT